MGRGNVVMGEDSLATNSRLPLIVRMSSTEISTDTGKDYDNGGDTKGRGISGSELIGKKRRNRFSNRKMEKRRKGKVGEEGSEPNTFRSTPSEEKGDNHSSRRVRFAQDQDATNFDDEFGHHDEGSSSSLDGAPDPITVDANIQGVVRRGDSISLLATSCTDRLVPLNMAESYLLAFTNDSSAISKLFSTKHFFHQAYVSCGFFQQTEPDLFSNHLVEKFKESTRLSIPKMVKEVFLEQERRIKSRPNTKTTSYEYAKRNLTLLTRIMCANDTIDETKLSKELCGMVMLSLRGTYGSQISSPPSVGKDTMIEYMTEHKQLLNHDTEYMEVFNNLGIFFRQGYIDKQLHIHPDDVCLGDSIFDGDKVKPTVKKIVTTRDKEETSYVFCANNTLSPSFIRRTIKGMNSSRYMKYPGASGDKANRYIRCATMCKSAVFELSKGHTLIPSRQPGMHELDMMKVANDGIIRKIVELVKEKDGKFPYMVPLQVNAVLSSFGGTKAAFGAHTDGGRFVNYTSLERYGDVSTRMAVQKAIPYVGFQFTITFVIGNGPDNQETMTLKWRCVRSNKVVATLKTKSNSVHIQWFKSQQYFTHEGVSSSDDNGIWRSTFTFRTMMVPSDSIMRRAMYDIRKVDGFDSSVVTDNGTMYTRKNIVKNFPGDPDMVELHGHEVDEEDLEDPYKDNDRNINRIDQDRRSERRALPQDSWKRPCDVNRFLSIPTTNVSPQHFDWEVMASKHVLPKVLKDGYELVVKVIGKRGTTSLPIRHGFPKIGGEYVQIGECVQMSTLYATFNLDAKRIYHECWHHDTNCTNGLFPNQLYKNDPASIIKLALILFKRHDGIIESITDTDMITLTTKIRGSGANSKIEGDTPRDAVQQEERGGSAGRVADNQRLTPLNIALQNLHCREAVVPLFFPRSLIDTAESHSEEFLGTNPSINKSQRGRTEKKSLWDKLLEGSHDDVVTNPKMVFMGMFSTTGFRHDRLDRETVRAEASKYLPDSEKDRNMQSFKIQSHMCLDITLERLTPPPPKKKQKEINISSNESGLFMLSTKSGVRNAISLAHNDSLTKDDITRHFVSQQKWRSIEEGGDYEELDTATEVDVGSFVDRLCGVSVAGCYRFQKANIEGEECYYLDAPKYESIGAVSRMKAMPMPSRANDVGPLFFQWSFGFKRLQKGQLWCKENVLDFSNTIFQAVFHTMTGRVVALERLSNHLRQHMVDNNMPVPDDPDQPIYPTTETYKEALYFILSTLKGKRTSMSIWVIDQFAPSIPTCLKTIAGFEKMLMLLAEKVRSIAENLTDEARFQPSLNKREMAFEAIYGVLSNFSGEDEKNRLKFLTTLVLNNLDEVLLYPFGTPEEYTDFDYMAKSVFPGFGGARGAEAFLTTNKNWKMEANHEKRARAKLRIIWEEVQYYLLNLPTGREYVLDCLLLEKNRGTLRWIINQREFNFVDCEQGLCKSFIALAAVRPSRCITSPKPYNNYTFPVRLTKYYPPNCHLCYKNATDTFEKVAIRENSWPSLNQEYEYKI